MIRFVVLAVALVILCFAVARIWRAAHEATIDWTGVATIVGFVTLAFWLRHLTGLG